MDKPVVYVIDDDDAVRTALRFLLRSADFEARTFESGQAFLDDLPCLDAGCIVTDVRMPGIDGLELVRRMRAAAVDLPVIVITGHGDIPLAVEAMKAGALDFIEKPFSDETLLGAIHAALDKEGAVAKSATAKHAFDALVAGLSPRERDVLAGVVAGKVNKVIAHDLGISPRTVEVYRASMMTKTRANSLSELVRMAMLAGL